MIAYMIYDLKMLRAPDRRLIEFRPPSIILNWSFMRTLSLSSVSLITSSMSCLFSARSRLIRRWWDVAAALRAGHTARSPPASIACRSWLLVACAPRFHAHIISLSKWRATTPLATPESECVPQCRRRRYLSQCRRTAASAYIDAAYRRPHTWADD